MLNWGELVTSPFEGLHKDRDSTLSALHIDTINNTLDHSPDCKVYGPTGKLTYLVGISPFFFNMSIFQPAMLDHRSVTTHSYPLRIPN